MKLSKQKIIDKLEELKQEVMSLESQIDQAAEQENYDEAERLQNLLEQHE
jgi:hypothetical protein